MSGTRTTIGVPYRASVATVAGGGVALTLTCAHCGDECPLDIEAEQLDAVAQLTVLSGTHLTASGETLRALANARAAAALPECVRIAVWLLTHTTGHHEAMLREVARG